MNDENEITFCGKPFGTNKPPLIIAEIGFNHNGEIEPGTTFTSEMISLKRPRTGIPPTDLERVIGQKAKTKILAEQIVT